MATADAAVPAAMAINPMPEGDEEAAGNARAGDVTMASPFGIRKKIKSMFGGGKKVPLAINGFGRIGRQVARLAMADPDIELKLINASYDAEYMAYMMKYDTVHGKYDGTVETDGDSLVIDGQKVALSHTRDPAEIPFAANGADYVCESTGVFLTTDKIAPHLAAGAKKVI